VISLLLALAAVLAAAVGDPVPPRGLPPEDVLDDWEEHADDVEGFLKKRWCGALKSDGRKLEPLFTPGLVAPDFTAAKATPAASGAWTSETVAVPEEASAREPAAVAAALERYFSTVAVRARCSIGFHYFVLAKGKPRVAEARFLLLVAGLGPDGRHVEDSGEVRAELEREPDRPGGPKGAAAWRIARIGFEPRLRVWSDWSHFREVGVAAKLPVSFPEPEASANSQFYGDNLDRGGLAVGDVNGDGILDVFVAADGTSLLLLGKADGTFDDAAAKLGVANLGDARGSLLVDLDNDGRLDLVVATRGAKSPGQVLVFRNDGKRFLPAATLRGGPVLHLTAGDVNNDGLLDVFAGAYGVFGGKMPSSLLDSTEGAQDLLFINQGKFKFAERAREWGFKEKGWTQSAVLVDLDGDGKVDLVAADDFGRKRVHRNLGGKFEDVSQAAGPGAERANGMSIAVGDIDGDGRQDLYFGNMHSNAGQRIASGFVGPPALRERLHAATVGNTLWLAQPDGKSFKESGVDLGVNDGGWAYGVQMFDADDDGNLDVHSPCGFLTSAREDEL